MRQCIERAFGILVARWLTLSKPLQVAKSKWTLVSIVCAKLHNFLVSEDSGSYQGSASQFWNGIRLGIRKTGRRPLVLEVLILLMSKFAKERSGAGPAAACVYLGKASGIYGP